MNFLNTLPRRRPKDTFDAETQEVVEKDPGCEIVAAILPLCREQLTNVTWLVLSGIELGETDLDELGTSKTQDRNPTALSNMLSSSCLQSARGKT
jgi:hypothetical protein